MQELSWEVPGGISADEYLQVDVYDHETIGRNRCIKLCMGTITAHSKKRIVIPTNTLSHLLLISQQIRCIVTDN